MVELELRWHERPPDDRNGKDSRQGTRWRTRQKAGYQDCRKKSREVKRYPKRSEGFVYDSRESYRNKRGHECRQRPWPHLEKAICPTGH